MRTFWLSLLLLSSPLYALNRIEFNLGRATPQTSIQAGGSSDRQGSRGTAWSVDLLHQEGGPVSVGIGGGYFHSSDYLSPSFVPNHVSTISSNARSIMLLTRTDLSANPRFTPYAIAGAGWVKNALTVTDSTGERLIDDAHSTYGYVFGLGLDLALTDRLFIGLEGRYQGSVSRSFELSPAAQALTGHNSIDAHLDTLLFGLKVGVRY